MLPRSGRNAPSGSSYSLEGDGSRLASISPSIRRGFSFLDQTRFKGFREQAERERGQARAWGSSQRDCPVLLHSLGRDGKRAGGKVYGQVSHTLGGKAQATGSASSGTFKGNFALGPRGVSTS
jgi:hypothetical protein